MTELDHASFEQIADYFAGFLEESESDALEAHLFACGPCAIELERLGGLAAAVRDTVPPIISRAQFEAFAREGRIAQENPMSPGEVAEVRYPPEGKLLVHRLGGFDLKDASRVDFELIGPEGSVLMRLDDVPFDPQGGELLVACQAHFVEQFPRDTRFRVEAVGGSDPSVATYTVSHRM